MSLCVREWEKNRRRNTGSLTRRNVRLATLYIGWREQGRKNRDKGYNCFCRPVAVRPEGPPLRMSNHSRNQSGEDKCLFVPRSPRDRDRKMFDTVYRRSAARYPTSPKASASLRKLKIVLPVRAEKRLFSKKREFVYVISPVAPESRI